MHNRDQRWNERQKGKRERWINQQSQRNSAQDQGNTQDEQDGQGVGRSYDAAQDDTWIDYLATLSLPDDMWRHWIDIEMKKGALNQSTVVQLIDRLMENQKNCPRYSQQFAVGAQRIDILADLSTIFPVRYTPPSMNDWDDRDNEADQDEQNGLPPQSPTRGWGRSIFNRRHNDDE